MRKNDAGQEGADPAEASRLGRLLAEAKGFTVVGSDGHAIGTLAYVRYERYADRPDEVVIRRRGLRSRQLVIPFESIASVDPDQKRVRLEVPAQATNGSAERPE